MSPRLFTILKGNLVTVSRTAVVTACFQRGYDSMDSIPEIIRGIVNSIWAPYQMETLPLRGEFGM